MAFPVGSTAKKLSIDSSKVSGSSDLTNFPVLVKDSNIQSAVYASYDFGTHSLDLERSSSQYAYSGASPTGLNITGDFTIEAWVRWEAFGAYNQVIFSKGEWGTDAKWSYYFYIDSNDHLAILYSANGTSNYTNPVGTTALTQYEGQLIHVAAVVDVSAKNAKFYINGKPLDNITHSAGSATSISNNTSICSVGSRKYSGSHQDFLDGKISHVRVWSGLRTDSEIAAYYNRKLIGTETNLHGLWFFDNDYTDETSNGNDLTASGSPVFATEIPPLVPSDIRFTSDSSGTTELPFEIVSFSPSAETAEIWVKVPTVSYNTDTDFYMWYGDATLTPYAPSDTYGSQNVWRSEYKAVYHLQESSGQRNDSTANANNLTDNNTVASGTGKIGTGADFERSNSEYLSKIDNASISTTGDFTISGWLKLEQLASSAGGAMALLSKYDFTNADREYLLAIRNTTDKFSIFYSSAGTNFTEIQSATTLSAGNVGSFLYITAITDVSAQTTTFVINGSSESGTAVSTNATSVRDGASPLVLGANDEGRADYLDAVLDEMRLYFGLQTSDWAITEYNNQNSPSTFLTMSDTFTPDSNLTMLGVG